MLKRINSLNLREVLYYHIYLANVAQRSKFPRVTSLKWEVDLGFEHRKSGTGGHRHYITLPLPPNPLSFPTLSSSWGNDNVPLKEYSLEASLKCDANSLKTVRWWSWSSLFLISSSDNRAQLLICPYSDISGVSWFNNYFTRDVERLDK